MYKPRSIEFNNGLDGAIPRYCILHCKCRTQESLMSNILMTKNNEEIYELVASKGRGYPTLKNFS